jgi:hypothetical protein
MLHCVDAAKRPAMEGAELHKPGFCGIRQRLVDAFTDAVREMSFIENEQIEAVIEGDSDFSRFDLLLHYAQEKKDTAKYAWIAHVESHGC